MSALPARREEERGSKKPPPPEATSASASPSPPATPPVPSPPLPASSSSPPSPHPPRRDQQQQDHHRSVHPTQRLPTPALRPPPHSPRRVSLSPADSGRDVVIEGLVSSVPLLRGLPPGLTRWFRPSGDEGGEEDNDLVLAFDAAGGETAMEDVPLGQVRKFSFFKNFSSFFPFISFHRSPRRLFRFFSPLLFPISPSPSAHPSPLPRRGQGQALVDDSGLGHQGLLSASGNAVSAPGAEAGGALRSVRAAARRFRLLQGHAEARKVSKFVFGLFGVVFVFTKKKS